VSTSLPTVEIINSPVTALRFDAQMAAITAWAEAHVSNYVCVANTHMLIEAYRSDEFRQVLWTADLVTPDGMPLVWMMKLLGAHHQNRVAGMDIFQDLCRRASQEDISVFLVGSQSRILDCIRTRLERDFPHLNIAGMEPLPFRPLTLEEDTALIQQINASGAGLVFVSLGCPKQEAWMAAHKGKVQAVMLGLGGVFPIYAGIQKRAPLWVRKAGLEWLYRLMQEPKRLWKRYGSTIPLFLGLALAQLFKESLPKRDVELKPDRLSPYRQ
jgi:N-acetylglucosaminyldiphosphoundecaprenol N-acetyl-beta-D-mannosaminyltransferase